MKVTLLPITLDTFCGSVRSVMTVNGGEVIKLDRDYMPPLAVSIRRGGKIVTDGWKVFIMKCHGFPVPAEK